MPKGILETLKEEIHDGELIALIETNSSEVKKAFLSVIGRVTESLQGIDAEDYHSCIQVNEEVNGSKNKLIVLSRKSVILTPNPRKIGRTGFFIPEMFQFLRQGVLLEINPTELYVGEYEIKEGFRNIPQLAPYTGLITSYPQHA